MEEATLSIREEIDIGNEGNKTSLEEVLPKNTETMNNLMNLMTQKTNKRKRKHSSSSSSAPERSPTPRTFTRIGGEKLTTGS